MALLRRGSSRISEDNFNCRLQRERAKTGAITASLAWNSPSDLDLHAVVCLGAGGSVEICYRTKQAAGGVLDVDMHARDSELVDEPVENIFWKKPPAGTYSIQARMFKPRGEGRDNVPFRALLKREGEDDLSVEGALGRDTGRSVECFRFTVDADGEVTMHKVGTPMPAAKAAAGAGAAPRAAAKAPARAKGKAKAKGKGKARAMKAPLVMKKAMKVKAMKVKPMKVSKVKGRTAKAQVYAGVKAKTVGGLKKDDLAKTKKGEIVSKKRHEKGLDNKWCKAVAKARAEKGYAGFRPIKKGSSFYVRAQEIYKGS